MIVQFEKNIFYIRFMYIFDKVLIKTILCCSINAYLIVIMSYHFYFMYFTHQYEMFPNFVKFIMLDLFEYILANYEKYFL